jgi:hypothetical protein
LGGIERRLDIETTIDGEQERLDTVGEGYTSEARGQSTQTRLLGMAGCESTHGEKEILWDHVMWQRGSECWLVDDEHARMAVSEED